MCGDVHLRIYVLQLPLSRIVSTRNGFHTLLAGIGSVQKARLFLFFVWLLVLRASFALSTLSPGKVGRRVLVSASFVGARRVRLTLNAYSL